MKKAIDIGLISLAVLTLVSVTNIVKAQQNNKTAGSNSQAALDYTLPYPGLLPDHPLYSLKVARDKIIALFITDVNKKAEFDLLMSDKRINSGISLADKNNYSLAINVFFEGQKYLENGIEILELEKNRKNNVNGLIDLYSRAGLKHQEVINAVIKKSPEKYKSTLRDLLEKEKELTGKIQKLKNG